MFTASKMHDLFNISYVRVITTNYNTKYIQIFAVFNILRLSLYIRIVKQFDKKVNQTNLYCV